MKKFIAISGRAGSGKDTVGQIIQRKLGGTLCHIADPLKDEFCEVNGISRAEFDFNKELYRSDLIKFGNDYHSRNPVQYLRMLPNYGIVCDLRYIMEYTWFSGQQALMVRVCSDPEDRKRRGRPMNIDDRSETELDNIIQWDWIIHNTGSLEELEADIDKQLSIFPDYKKWWNYD